MMISDQKLSTNLKAALPKDLEPHASEMARLLVDVANEQVTIEVAAASIAADPNLTAIVRKLAGKEISIDSSLVSFGTGNQYGDIAIRDVVGRDRVTIHTGIHPPPKRARVIIAATIIGLAILTIGGGGAIAWSTLNGAIAAAPTSEVDLEVTPLSALDPSSSPTPRPTVTTSATATFEPTAILGSTPIPNALDFRRFESGYVEYIDVYSLPLTRYRLGGPMEVTYYESFVRVALDEGEVYYIPWDRIVYIGSSQLPVN